MMTILILLVVGIALGGVLIYLRKAGDRLSKAPSEHAPVVVPATSGFTDAEINVIREMIEVTTSSIRFDFRSNPNAPEVQIHFCVRNKSQYELLIEKMDWQITVGSKPSPSARGFTVESFALSPQSTREDLLVRQAMDHVEARHISHSKQGLIATGYIEGVLKAHLRETAFEKRFLLPNAPCIVEEERGALLNMYIDPTHLDPLSGLFNHKFLTENMQIVVDTADVNHPVSFIMIDIDDFKRINDEYGHLIGDDVLKMVAGKMREIVGSRGFSIRYGGDEFCILMRDQNIDEAKQVAHELRQQVVNYIFKTPAGTLHVTVSMGIGMLEEKRDYKELIQQADDMLRLSKKTGKDKISD